MKFFIVDVETTGGNPRTDRITEVGIVSLENGEIRRVFHSLINPEKEIPLSIRVLTGITQEMVQDAPLFSEVADEIHKLLNYGIFVAHNVKFDYAFVAAEMKRCHLEFKNRPKLCTVKYSRRVLPGLKRYNLAALCKKFDIENDNPHRALGDAVAAAEILRFVQKLDRKDLLQYMLKHKAREASYPHHVSRKDIEQLPNSPGVYFFNDSSGKTIYVGKARDIKKRVISHFTGSAGSQIYQSLNREVHRIDWEETGSEALALLLEDHEIISRYPRYNKAQKRRAVYYGVYAYRDKSDSYRLGINRVRNQFPPLRKFRTLYAARTWLMEQVAQYELDTEKCNLSFLDHPRSSISVHNERFEHFRRTLGANMKSYLILKKGRTREEQAFIYVEKGSYKGIGYAPRSLPLRSEPELALDYLIPLRSGSSSELVVENELAGKSGADCVEF